MSKKVVLLEGGNSEEREVSLISSAAIFTGLVENGYEVIRVDPADFKSYLELGQKLLSLNPYIVFIGLHGGEGEDGTIQAFLKLLNIPFTGSGMTSSSLCMDKTLSYGYATAIGIKVPPYFTLSKDDEIDFFRTERLFGYPVVVKPNNTGSSVGISIARSQQELAQSVEVAFSFSDAVIVQKFISGSELTVSILGKEALPIVEIKVNDGWYDYTNKYTKGKTIYEVPAKIDDDDAIRLQAKSLAIFNAFRCQAYARIDYRYDGTEYYFLEVNTLPGMTELSLTPMAAKEKGYSFAELIEIIIRNSLV